MLSPLGFSFPKTIRLLTARDYDRAFKRSKAFRSDQFLIITRRNRANHARLGMAITKKKCPKANKRNVIKRQVRESYRHACRSFPAVDIVVLLRKSFGEDKSNTHLTAELTTLWQQLTDYYADSPSDASKHIDG